MISKHLLTDGWTEVFTSISRIRSLKDGWDGEGSVAPSHELIDYARQTAMTLLDAGLAPPSRVHAGVNGTIFFEWHTDGVYKELEIIAPGQTQVFVKGSTDEC